MAEKISFTGPAHDADTITPDDEEFVRCRSVFVTATGDIEGVTVGMADDATPKLFEAIPVGVFPVAFKKITEGTTATVIALY